MRLTRIAIALALGTTAMTVAADTLDLTVYRSDDAALYSSADTGVIDAGYALIHERRRVELEAGAQTLRFGGLPPALDIEALDFRLPQADAVVASRRLLLPGSLGLIGSRLGDRIKVLGASGNLLAEGVLRGVDGGLVVETARGTSVVRDYASVEFAETSLPRGARLDVGVDARSAGASEALLDFPTTGIGWRAAYSALLEDAKGCRITLASDASIANRSGRDLDAGTLTLVAGAPRFAKPQAPQAKMMRAAAAPAMMDGAPMAQAALGDYRSYTIKGGVSLPDASVTLAPLYAPQVLACTRSWVLDYGNAWQPRQPITDRDYGTGEGTIESRLGFRAFDNLPAGFLRVVKLIDERREFLGEARIIDTAKNQNVEVTLGTPFDLVSRRERTAFALDAAARRIDEAFRITLDNSGQSARTITVREHPSRWHDWKLVSSSIKPARSTPDTLEFAVDVPAGGSATLDYALRYQWLPTDDR